MKPKKIRLELERPSFSQAVQNWYMFANGETRSSMCQPKSLEITTSEAEDNPFAVCWAAVENAIYAMNFPYPSLYNVVRETLASYRDGIDNEDRITERCGDWSYIVTDLLIEVEKTVDAELDRYAWYVPMKKARRQSSGATA